MSARIVVSCDGHRHGQPCRGALPTTTEHCAVADDQRAAAGWRETWALGRGFVDLCPSLGHDEDGDR
ncbi:MAG: hypothetical protein HOV66_30600 [Streptomycetaceae bacterium]|nr:hypothetical protein [Nocardioidaceae bacterium]NUS59174.1 hypothetical protein [Streptomycetaceae bacterium]